MILGLHPSIPLRPPLTQLFTKFVNIVKKVTVYFFMGSCFEFHLKGFCIFELYAHYKRDASLIQEIVDMTHNNTSDWT